MARRSKGDRVAGRMGQSPVGFCRTLLHVHNGGLKLLGVFVEGASEILGEVGLSLERKGIIDPDFSLLDRRIPQRHGVGTVEAVGFQVIPDGPPGVETHPNVTKIRVVLEFLGFLAQNLQTSIGGDPERVVETTRERPTALFLRHLFQAGWGFRRRCGR